MSEIHLLCLCPYASRLTFPGTGHKFFERLTMSGSKIALEHWPFSHPHIKPCDVYQSKKYAWSVQAIPKNSTWAPRLSPAPRLTADKFKKGREFNVKHPNSRLGLVGRLHEWCSLYNDVPPEDSWVRAFYCGPAGFPEDPNCATADEYDGSDSSAYLVAPFDTRTPGTNPCQENLRAFLKMRSFYSNSNYSH